MTRFHKRRYVYLSDDKTSRIFEEKCQDYVKTFQHHIQETAQELVTRLKEKKNKNGEKISQLTFVFDENCIGRQQIFFIMRIDQLIQQRYGVQLYQALVMKSKQIIKQKYPNIQTRFMIIRKQTSFYD